MTPMRLLNPADPLLQIIMFFATNPDEELRTSDVSAKTGITRQRVYGQLGQATKRGMLTRLTGTRGRMRMESVYSAGPALLKMIGRAP